jgi:hypothetical protein
MSEDPDREAEIEEWFQTSPEVLALVIRGLKDLAAGRVTVGPKSFTDRLSPEQLRKSHEAVAQAKEQALRNTVCRKP